VEIRGASGTLQMQVLAEGRLGGGGGQAEAFDNAARCSQE